MTLSFRNTGLISFSLLALFFIIATLVFLPGYFVTAMIVAVALFSGLLVAYDGIKKYFPVLLVTMPFSMVMPVFGTSTIIFPSELIAAALGISVIVAWMVNPSKFNALFRHPVTVLLFLSMVFIFISLFFSSMPMVSLKSVLVKTIYAVSFYVGSFLYLHENTVRKSLLNSYLVPLLLIVGIILYHHAQFSFSKDMSGHVTKPFFNDHTVYSAVIAFFLPLVFAKSILSQKFTSAFWILVTFFLLIALYFAASRAAWLSVIIAAVVGILVFLRLPSWGFFMMMILALSILFIQSENLVEWMKSNRNDSNARSAGIAEQTRSVSNITNDQSNAERLNRWKCALRMFEDKPLTGFGPGTYQFEYLSYQRDYDMTRISVTSPYDYLEGRGGTAHNEFLLLLSESGAGAALSFLLAIMVTFVIGIRCIYRDHRNKLIHGAMLMSFITFVIHSMFNNFMDTDKAAVLFYFAMAWFVVGDIKLKAAAGDEN